MRNAAAFDANHLERIFYVQERSCENQHMVFCPTPDAVFGMVGFSLPRLLLGKKESDPAFWRTLTDLPKRKRLSAKTISKLTDFSAEFARRQGIDQTLDPMKCAKQVSQDTDWGPICAGLAAAPGAPYPTFRHEVLRLEASARETRSAVESGDLATAAGQITRWELASLSSVQTVIERLDPNGTREQFAQATTPLMVVSALYLLACWEIEEPEGAEQHLAETFLPELRGDELIRPMRRWMEHLRNGLRLNSLPALSDRLLAPLHRDEDIETLRREVRKWWQGEIPAWSRTRRIVDSLGAPNGMKFEDHKRITYRSLRVVRILNWLLDLSYGIRDEHLPQYDPLSPFRDYLQMRSHALDRKAALAHIK